MSPSCCHHRKQSITPATFLQSLTPATSVAVRLLVGGTVALCVAIVLAITYDTLWRRWRRRQGLRDCRSAIYVGNVRHIRYKPTRHGFTYPVFYCLLDLDEIELAIHRWMWPVASTTWWALARLRAADHLKPPTGAHRAARTAARRGRVSGMAERVRDMVEEATGERPTGRIQLLTHLAYFGYYFNPVSFYYCLDESERHIETVVGEVSNTPWGEMHCYVLNPKSKGVEVPPDSDRPGTVRYRFNKDFHVSPFMGMNHAYDWSFVPPLRQASSKLTVTMNMFERVDNAAGGNGGTDRVVGAPDGNGGTERCDMFFNARLHVTRREFTAVSLLWHMVAYPFFTLWVQLLIHFEAFRLWMKQVPYFPHPTGYETTASRLIGMIMAPLFSFQEAWRARREHLHRD